MLYSQAHRSLGKVTYFPNENHINGVKVALLECCYTELQNYRIVIITASSMSAREFEDALLTRCAVAAREVAPTAQNQLEANVFQLAASVIQSKFPSESTRLMLASEQYFDQHPNEKLTSADVVRRGWVLGLPRLHDRLIRRLHQPNLNDFK